MPFSAINDQAILFITTNVKHRRWYFVTSERAATLGQAIQTCCRLKNFELLAYCILPNHVHLLVKRRTLGSIRSMDKEDVFLFPSRRSNRMLESMRPENEGELPLHPDRRLSQQGERTDQREMGSSRSEDKGNAFLHPYRRLRRTLENVHPEDQGRLSPHFDRRLFPPLSKDRSGGTPPTAVASRRSTNHSPSLSQLLQSIKGTFSRSLPKGSFWQRRSYVLHVESENYLDTLIDYVRFNYTKMNLPERYGQAPFVLINDKNLRNLF